MSEIASEEEAEAPEGIKRSALRILPPERTRRTWPPRRKARGKLKELEAHRDKSQETTAIWRVSESRQPRTGYPKRISYIREKIFRRHACIHIYRTRKIRAGGETQTDLAGGGRRHCTRDTGEYLHERLTHQTRKRAPGRQRSDRRTRDGGHRGRNRRLGADGQARRPGDSERGDFLRRMFLLQTRTRQ